jgi:uncharacterized protein YqeY
MLASMSTLKQTLRDDLQDSIRAREQMRTATLRMVLSALTVEEVAGEVARELSDEEVQAVLRREAKKRREAAEAFADGGRVDRAQIERDELAVIETYLPAQLDDDALVTLVREAIASTGAQGMPAMGQVMRAAQAAASGQADGKRLSTEVRRQLAG